MLYVVLSVLSNEFAANAEPQRGFSQIVGSALGGAVGGFAREAFRGTGFASPGFGGLGGQYFSGPGYYGRYPGSYGGTSFRPVIGGPDFSSSGIQRGIPSYGGYRGYVGEFSNRPGQFGRSFGRFRRGYL